MSRDDFYDSLFGRAYSAYMDRPRLSRAIARLAWGSDVRPYYESMDAIAELTDGGTIVDCPCGAGPALRALQPDAEVRYLAADLSPSMLRRARERAAARGLAGVEFIEADAAELPLEPDSADLFLSYWGLHCFPDPRAAVTEIGRVLKPGGRLVGASFVNEPKGLRQRLLLRKNTADFGPLCTEAELLGWMREASLSISASSRSGAMLFFDARAGSAELGDQQA